MTFVGQLKIQLIVKSRKKVFIQRGHIGKSNKEMQGPSKSMFGALTGSVGLSKRQRMCITDGLGTVVSVIIVSVPDSPVRQSSQVIKMVWQSENVLFWWVSGFNLSFFPTRVS